MSEKQVRDDIEKLRQLIATLDSDDQAKQRLQALLSEIEPDLADLNAEGSLKGLASKLEAKIEEFETTHPTVTGILNNVMVTLSSMGV